MRNFKKAAIIAACFSVTACSTLFGDDLETLITDLDKKGIEKAKDFKAAYCELSPLERRAADNILNSPSDPNSIIISCN